MTTAFYPFRQKENFQFQTNLFIGIFVTNYSFCKWSRSSFLFTGLLQKMKTKHPDLWNSLCCCTTRITWSYFLQACKFIFVGLNSSWALDGKVAWGWPAPLWGSVAHAASQEISHSRVGYVLVEASSWLPWLSQTLPARIIAISLHYLDILPDQINKRARWWNETNNWCDILERWI